MIRSLKLYEKNPKKPHKYCTFRHIYGIINVSEICFEGSARMKIPENISPEIAAYIKALQSENSKLQNENSEIKSKNSELQNEVSDLKNKVAKQELQISNLTEMLVNSRKKMFGKSSEKSKYFNDAQMSLFN